jgi:3-phenylpropionate/trans-cinnamate dioxygenase ferredoxin reductase component
MEILGTYNMQGPIVIVGSGISAISLATEIRANNSAVEIVIISDDREAPYDRPQLSKEYLRDGENSSFRLNLERAPDVEWLRGQRAESLNTDAKRITLSNGRSVAYGALVLATGAEAKRLPNLVGSGVPITTLRTLEDASFIREHLRPGKKLVIVGGGVIGLEVAATARAVGADVTLVEALPRVLNRCAPFKLASFIADYHANRGVAFHFDRLSKNAAASSLLLDNGRQLHADLIVVGIGVVANDALAKNAGIACDDGIFVDRYGRTTCPDVYAVGDVTRQLNPVSDRFERIETWSNAQNQALTLGRALAGGPVLPYSDIPWYWSDQYDLQIQVAGIPAGDEEVFRGRFADAQFSIIQLRKGKIVGVASVNRSREFNIFKRLIASDRLLDASILSDESINIREYVKWI